MRYFDFSIVTIIAFLACYPITFAFAQEFNIDQNMIASIILKETNAYRQSKGVVELTSNDALQRNAKNFSHYLAETNTFGHRADGRSPDQRIRQEGYMPCSWAENIWEGWSRPKRMSDTDAANKAMAGWKKSPGHEANLRNVNVRNLGVGVSGWNHDGKQYIKIVQVFGTVCKKKPKTIKMPASKALRS